MNTNECRVSGSGCADTTKSSGSSPSEGGGALGANPKDRLGILKPQLDLIPPASLIYQALAMQHGARTKGYGPFNWRTNPVIASIYIAAALRHIYKFLDGQELDEESGYPELGHALASLGILVDAKENGNLIDDRPVKGNVLEIIQRFTKAK